MILTLCFLASFTLGAIPTAFLVAKKARGIDIRKEGSGNVGATNAFRVLGKKYGAFVFLVDFLKGALPAWIMLNLFSADPQAPLLALAAGIAAILGHIFTPFLGFKGGKGVATGAGALCGSFPLLFLCAALVWLLVFLCTKIVSLSSLLALGILVPLSFWLVEDRRTTLVFFALFLLIAWSHRANLVRLWRGEEHSFAKKN